MYFDVCNKVLLLRYSPALCTDYKNMQWCVQITTQRSFLFVNILMTRLDVRQ